ncbi:ATP-binding protein [Neobacillus drentensis]|uniref:sensor histidine kinase n=1 Tax=Neobacillus drentensis TaxID=220684 RepID=UPI003000AD7E
MLRSTVQFVSLLTVILFIVSAPQYYQYINANCITHSCEAFYNPAPGIGWLKDHGLTPAEYSFAYDMIYVVFGIVYITIGLVILWKKSSHLIGLLCGYMLISLGGTFTPIMWGLKVIHPVYLFIVQIIEAGGMAAFILFFFLFPNGRFAPKWSKYLCLILITLRIPGMLLPKSDVDLQYISKWLFACWFILWVGSLLFVQIYRYKFVLTSIEKQQAKWVVYGEVIALLGLLSLTAIYIITEKSIETMPYHLFYMEIGIHTTMLIIPAAILMAMMKHRLWDIDLLVNRTLVYGIMTVCTVVVYVLGVWYSSLLFQTSNNLISSLIATGIVAVLFTPVKDKVQRFINRRMYGENDEPFTVLFRLAKELEHPNDPESVLHLVVRTIKDSLRIPYVSLSLYQNGEAVVAAEDGIFSEDWISYRLIYQGNEIGEIKLSRRAPGESFTSSDQKFIEILVRQASVVTQSAKISMDLKLLAEDLQESRENLVFAREEERRKLRSNLHDDLAPRLAALALTAAAAEELVDHNPYVIKDILSELRSTIRQTVSEIRGLVYDLRPPTLDEMGLIGAIHERIKDLSAPSSTQRGIINSDRIAFTLNAPEQLPALPAAVEVAAYRITTEAIVNVLRHAKAKTCTITLAIKNQQERGLVITIEDDGIGISPIRNYKKNSGIGIGIGSMKERAAELGGQFRLKPNIQGGTVITVFLPVNTFLMGEMNEKG